MTTNELIVMLKAVAAELAPLHGDQSQWFLFGSALRDAEAAADYDVAIICSQDAAIGLRTALEPLCSRLPLHLMILTPNEDHSLNFTAGQGAQLFFPE